MGLKDFMWDTSPVGRITKYVSINFIHQDKPESYKQDFKDIMRSLNYSADNEFELDDFLEFINGNPLKFIFFLICIEYRKMPNNVEIQLKSIVDYICKRFDKHSKYSHKNYIPNLTYIDYAYLYRHCESILHKMHFKF